MSGSRADPSCSIPQGRKPGRCHPALAEWKSAASLVILSPLLETHLKKGARRDLKFLFSCQPPWAAADTREQPNQHRAGAGWVAQGRWMAGAGVGPCGSSCAPGRAERLRWRRQPWESSGLARRPEEPAPPCCPRAAGPARPGPAPGKGPALGKALPLGAPAAPGQREGGRPGWTMPWLPGCSVMWHGTSLLRHWEGLLEKPVCIAGSLSSSHWDAAQALPGSRNKHSQAHLTNMQWPCSHPCPLHLFSVVLDLLPTCSLTLQLP